MAGYYNPYNFYPVQYANQMGYAGYSGAPAQQPVMMQQPQTTGPNCAMAWVDGEIEARGRQIPQGVTQLAMWDTNSPKIYLKSINQMGMPNPMQILTYTMEEAQAALPAGQSGDNHVDLSNYATKDEISQLRDEIRNLMQRQNQNGSTNNNGNQNRGGNR